MATKSILKNINIQRHAAATRMIQALEYAAGKNTKKVVFSRSVSELKNESEIKKFFGADK